MRIFTQEIRATFIGYNPYFPKAIIASDFCIFIHCADLNMKKTIAENPYYILSAAPDKNRAYLKIIGFWRNLEVVSSYLDDWKKTLASVKPGFTLLTDATEMKTHPQELRKLHEDAQKLVFDAGLSKVAEVVKNDITEYQLDSIAETTAFPKKTFKSLEDAEKWLDS